MKIEATDGLSLDELTALPYARVLTPSEVGGYVASILELPGCFSEGETAQEAIENIEDAMRVCLEGALESSAPIPEPFETSGFSGKILLKLSRGLHKDVARRAKIDDVSVTRWIVGAISEKLGAAKATETVTSLPSDPR